MKCGKILNQSKCVYFQAKKRPLTQSHFRACVLVSQAAQHLMSSAAVPLVMKNCHYKLLL